ncbi:MAG: outer membrane protein transport protein [Gammaproteobacteria bacterium]|nr:outer membrane protein transport protein [Gammaproteobacteria bacterium]
MKKRGWLKTRSSSKLMGCVIHKLLVVVVSFVVEGQAYGAATQILNDIFYQNPAELSLVNKAQILAGNLYIRPAFEFTGISSGETGTVNSVVGDSLPYLLTAFRITDQFVAGINITPSGYGHLDWPEDSFVAFDSTVTNVLYYRGAIQTSYQFTDKLALGVGFNFEWNKLAELNFVIPGSGNQVNKISGLNYTGDVGLFYKINAYNNLTAAIYTAVDTLGYGTSTLGNVTVDNLSLNLTEASIIFVGLQHTVNEKWFVEGKVYWSNWTIQKNLDFTNTTTGSYVVPTDWKKVWSFQLFTRYVLNDNIAILGNLLYETNPGPLDTNAIGYPLAASGSLSLGLDVTVRKDLSAQIVYGYGAFLPNSPINNSTSLGTINANFQAATLQFIYKI